MKNIFMSKGLYTVGEQMDYIMRAPRPEHEAIAATIHARMEASTEQVCLPFSEWVVQDDPNMAVIGAVTPGSYIRNRIREEEQGE